MVIHLLFDVVSSLVVVISCFMIKTFKFYSFDPLCCFIVSFLIILTTIPLIKNIKRNMRKRTFDFSLLFKTDNITKEKLQKELKTNYLIYSTKEGNFLLFQLDERKMKSLEFNDKEEFCSNEGLVDVLFKFN